MNTTNNQVCSDESVFALEMKQMPFTELCTLTNLMDVFLVSGICVLVLLFVFLSVNRVLNICFDMTVMS